MAQDYTVVPGMAGGHNSGNNSSIRNKSGYSANGTFVPEMQTGFETSSEPKESKDPSVPIVGFLYSISRGVTEYWPIGVGSNTIGRNANHTIVLNERTISGNHAVLSVQKKKSTGEVVAVIKITEAKTPVLVNGDDIDLRDGSYCKNGDIITIGDCYTLLLVLINAEAVGLRKSDNFIASKSTREDQQEEEVVSNPVPPYNNIYSRQSNIGTVAIDGRNDEVPGGTVVMGTK